MGSGFSLDAGNNTKQKTAADYTAGWLPHNKENKSLRNF